MICSRRDVGFLIWLPHVPPCNSNSWNVKHIIFLYDRKNSFELLNFEKKGIFIVLWFLLILGIYQTTQESRLQKVYAYDNAEPQVSTAPQVWDEPRNMKYWYNILFYPNIKDNYYKHKCTVSTLLIDKPCPLFWQSTSRTT